MVAVALPVLLVVGCVTLAGIWGYGQYQSRTKKKLKAMTAAGAPPPCCSRTSS